MYDPVKLSKMTFSAAAHDWLVSRKDQLKPRTAYLNAQHVKHLNVWFGEQKLSKIHIGHLKEYQQARQTNAEGRWPATAAASLLNHELSAMQQILKRAGLWAKIAPFYSPLKPPASKSPKVLSDSEEIMVFNIAARNPDWQMAYWVASITCNTGASGTELRNIQLHELHLDGAIPYFTIKEETAKNSFRARVVVLNPTAAKQMGRCLERANSLGSGRPEHYLFPKRTCPGRWDASKPASDSWLRRSWTELRKAVGIPWLTPHCFRHQHITLRIESGDPIEIVAKDVGHSAPAMTRKYTHLRRERQQLSVNKIDPSVRFGPKSEGAEVINRLAAK